MVITFWCQTEDKSLPPDSQSSLSFLPHSGATRIQLESEKHLQGIENSLARVTVLEIPLESLQTAFKMPADSSDNRLIWNSIKNSKMLSSTLNKGTLQSHFPLEETRVDFKIYAPNDWPPNTFHGLWKVYVCVCVFICWSVCECEKKSMWIDVNKNLHYSLINYAH